MCLRLCLRVIAQRVGSPVIAAGIVGTSHTRFVHLSRSVGIRSVYGALAWWTAVGARYCRGTAWWSQRARQFVFVTSAPEPRPLISRNRSGLLARNPTQNSGTPSRVTPVAKAADRTFDVAVGMADESPLPCPPRAGTVARGSDGPGTALRGLTSGYGECALRRCRRC